MKKLLISVIMITMMLVSFTQVYAVSNAAVLFLMISPGARAAGMGEAFVALADDATAVYWNPAGLAFQDQREISLMHANWLPQFGADLFYDFGSYIHPVEGLGTFGFNVTYLNLGEQTITDETGPEALGTFKSYEYALSATYGTLLAENWGVGLGLRYIRSNLSSVGIGTAQGDGKANAFAFDLSTLYKNTVSAQSEFGC